MIDVGALVDDLDRIATRVDRLTVHGRDPERFFIERSDIVDDLRRLIADCQGRGRGSSGPRAREALPFFREAREANEMARSLPPSGSEKENKRLGG